MKLSIRQEEKVKTCGQKEEVKMYKEIREEEENQRAIFPSRSFKETLRVLSD